MLSFITKFSKSISNSAIKIDQPVNAAHEHIEYRMLI